MTTPPTIRPGSTLRDANPILIYVVDRWGRRVRINKNALEDPQRLIIPIYNNRGVKISDSASYKYKRDSGRAVIHKANIPGTPEFEKSQIALEALEKAWKEDEANKNQPIA